MTDTPDLSAVSTDELHAEITRRQRAASDAYWARRIANAKWLCPGCGMPDSAHTRDCPTDTECD